MATISHSVVFKDNTTKIIKIETMTSGDYSDIMTFQGYDHAFVTLGDATVGGSHSALGRIQLLVYPHSSTGVDRQNWPSSNTTPTPSQHGVFGYDAAVSETGTSENWGFYHKLPERAKIYVTNNSAVDITDVDVYIELRKQEAHSRGRR